MQRPGSPSPLLGLLGSPGVYRSLLVRQGMGPKRNVQRGAVGLQSREEGPLEAPGHEAYLSCHWTSLKLANF
jgi:hypothetical protein